MEHVPAWLLASLIYLAAAVIVVLLEVASLPLADVMRELEKRVGTSGLSEKAERKPV